MGISQDSQVTLLNEEVAVLTRWLHGGINCVVHLGATGGRHN